MSLNVILGKNAQPISEPCCAEKHLHSRNQTQPLRVNLLKDNALKPKLDVQA